MRSQSLASIHCRCIAGRMQINPDNESTSITAVPLTESDQYYNGSDRRQSGMRSMSAIAAAGLRTLQPLMKYRNTSRPPAFQALARAAHASSA
jgi:hypothetical protein